MPEGSALSVEPLCPESMSLSLVPQHTGTRTTKMKDDEKKLRFRKCWSVCVRVRIKGNVVSVKLSGESSPARLGDDRI